jgi:hypothetical protein
MVNIMAQPKLTQDISLDALDDWDGTVGQLFDIATELNRQYDRDKKIIVDAGYNCVSYWLDNSDVRAKEQAEWDRLHPKKLTGNEMQEHKNKVILQLLDQLGIKLTKKEINARLTTGKGFDDLLTK